MGQPRMLLMGAMLGVATLLPLPNAIAQARRVRVDSTFLAKDLDGDGRTDYIVRQSRSGPNEHMRAARLAIYLGARPVTQAAAWASEWNEEFGNEASFGDSLSVDSRTMLLTVALPEADYDDIRWLLVEEGHVRELITHGIDYGEGSRVAAVRSHSRGFDPKLSARCPRRRSA